MSTATVRIGDKDFALVWGSLARIRFSGLPEPVRTAGGAQALAVLLWCAVAEKPNPFPTWEHLADQLDLSDLSKYDEALVAIMPQKNA
jgi:NaMN:DMB phosphoribosyltransferase